VEAFPGSMLSGEHANGAGPYMMDTFRGLLSVFPASILPEKAISIASALVLLAAIFAIAYLWKQIYPKLKDSPFPAFEICASITMIALLITSLHSFIQDYALLLIAGIWSYQANRALLNSDAKNSIARTTNRFLLALPAVSWAYGFLPLICFAFKLMLWCAIALLISNLLLLRDHYRSKD
jgi:uncharacterized membrane protein YkvI